MLSCMYGLNVMFLATLYLAGSLSINAPSKILNRSRLSVKRTRTIYSGKCQLYFILIAVIISLKSW